MKEHEAVQPHEAERERGRGRRALRAKEVGSDAIRKEK
jgi:hypothetical protein